MRESSLREESNPGYWVISERYENWRLDRQDGFKKFGIPARFLGSIDAIKKGDLLFTYVSSGYAAFADIRRAEGHLIQLKLGGDYDTAYPAAIATKSVTVLEPANWVKLSEVAGRLALARGKDTRQLFRNALRRISKEDGEILNDLMTAAATKNMTEGRQ